MLGAPEYHGGGLGERLRGAASMPSHGGFIYTDTHATSGGPGHADRIAPLASMRRDW